MNPESEVVKMGAKKDKKLGEAVEKLEYISGDEKLRRIAELREKYILDEESEKEANREEALQIGRNEGINIGRNAGKKEEKLKIAKKLLKLKTPIEQIIDITELTKEEILELSNS